FLVIEPDRRHLRRSVRHHGRQVRERFLLLQQVEILVGNCRHRFVSPGVSRRSKSAASSTPDVKLASAQLLYNGIASQPGFKSAYQKMAISRLHRMAANPAGDWTIDDAEALCREHGIRCTPPHGGGSHWKVSDPTQHDILTIPQRRPIK